MKTIATTIAAVQAAPEHFTAEIGGYRDAAHNTYITFRDTLGFNAAETRQAEREWDYAISLADAVADIVAGKQPHTWDIVALRDSAFFS